MCFAFCKAFFNLEMFELKMITFLKDNKRLENPIKNGMLSVPCVLHSNQCEMLPLLP